MEKRLFSAHSDHSRYKTGVRTICGELLDVSIALITDEKYFVIQRSSSGI